MTQHFTTRGFGNTPTFKGQRREHPEQLRQLHASIQERIVMVLAIVEDADA